MIGMNGIKSICVLLLCGIHFISGGQGIAFRENNLKAALEKAKSENKPVFVDFMADWCDPCKQLSRNVFTVPEIAEYFNSRFVCVQVDVSKEENLAQQYRVQALPTLVFLDVQGKEQKRLVGMVGAVHLMYWAKVLNGDEPSVDDLWNQYRKDKKDLKVMQRILQEMPVYSSGLESRADAEKWQARVEKLFNEYWKMKPRAEMLNAEDLGIIMLYCRQWKEKSEPVEFVIKHFAGYAELVPAEMLITYLASYADALVKNLAMGGQAGIQASAVPFAGRSEARVRCGADQKPPGGRINDGKGRCSLCPMRGKRSGKIRPPSTCLFGTDGRYGGKGRLPEYRYELVAESRG